MRSVKGELVGVVETVPLSVLVVFVFVVVVWMCRDGVRESVGSREGIAELSVAAGAVYGSVVMI